MSEELNDITMEDWMANVSLLIQKGNYDLQLIPAMIYEWMDKKGRITKTIIEKKEYLARARAYRMVILSKNISDKPTIENKEALEKFCAMMNKGEFIGEEAERLKTLAKKMILFDMLKAEPK